ncbi:hypothetical protein [Candidatus Pantoea multigeneris]|uniref:Uncharacterized protein n=1 Tax=Candidatus Pantoea multigeneris TaxID=2608357 RepID=A0ABX0R8C9_9GAMM|nr:hypothetical protein [Pantoea multigeneris]NIF21327.1 hypothetical protein [Pantoea multigeneris]
MNVKKVMSIRCGVWQNNNIAASVIFLSETHSETGNCAEALRDKGLVMVVSKSKNSGKCLGFVFTAITN